VNIAKDIERIGRELKAYQRDVYKKVGAVGLKFIDDNFRLQGYQATKIIPWRATKKKINTLALGRPGHLTSRGILQGIGRLRRSPRTDSPGPGLVRWYTDVVYAAVHNQGFNGNENVRAHIRRIKTRDSFEGRKQKSTGVTGVKSFTRHMNIPRRQFMPTVDRPSEIFNKQIWTKINTDVQHIFHHT